MDGNHTFDFEGGPNTRKNHNIGRNMSYDTVVKLSKLVIRNIKEQIAVNLPYLFGLITG